MSEYKVSQTTEKLRRIIYIHKKLRNTNERSGVSANEILAYLKEYDFFIDETTLRKDLKFLREQLNAPLPIKANRYSGYYYENDTYSLLSELDGSKTSEIRDIVSTVRRFYNAYPDDFVGLEDVLLKLEHRSFVLNKEQCEYISFEEVKLKGRSFLLPLLKHIRSGDFLTLEYKVRFLEPIKTTVIYPIMLKQYNNRWFLIAWEEDISYVVKLALDRIITFGKTNHKFKYSTSFSLTEHFAPLIGITFPEGQQMEKVVLRSHSEYRANYLITKPLHPSQIHSSIPDTKQYQFELMVVVNQELTSKILEYAADIEVIEPRHLRNKIKKIATKMLSRYT